MDLWVQVTNTYTIVNGYVDTIFSSDGTESYDVSIPSNQPTPLTYVNPYTQQSVTISGTQIPLDPTYQEYIYGDPWQVITGYVRAYSAGGGSYDDQTFSYAIFQGSIGKRMSAIHHPRMEPFSILRHFSITYTTLLPRPTRKSFNPR